MLTMPSYQDLVKTIQQRCPTVDLPLVRRAYDYARTAHRGVHRSSGEPYIQHPLATAIILASMRLDVATICAGLLHDVPDDTPITVKEIELAFGPDVAFLVSGVTKLGKVKYRGMERYVENLRKMFIAMAKDIRVILIKFADRLHNLRTLDALPPEKRVRIAQESLEIFAPLADRLQMGMLRDQIEDLAFKHLKPEEYVRLEQLIKQRTARSDEYLDRIKKKMERELNKSAVQFASVHGRKKHLYSLYSKLQSHDNDITRIYDLMALRVVVKNTQDCYSVLGLVHNLWKPLKGRIKDYIAQPKPNGYQSLHTTVFCDEGQIVEFQIRTQEMHETAEYGITAHWHYDEHGAVKFDKQLNWVKELLKAQRAFKDNEQFLQTLRIDIFKNRIFVFTPKGDVIELPEQSTPVDLAYQIHTEIGNKCSWAKINDRIVSLDANLHNGDVVEIFTDKNRKGPNPEWLRFVKTTTARAKIRAYARDTLFERLKQYVASPNGT